MSTGEQYGDDPISPSYYSPDGVVHKQPWWEEAPTPQGQPPLSVAEELIGQIETGGGKNSAFLTAQLNAWITRGSLTAEEAELVQSAVSVNDEYAPYWLDYIYTGNRGKI